MFVETNDNNDDDDDDSLNAKQIELGDEELSWRHAGSY